MWQERHRTIICLLSGLAAGLALASSTNNAHASTGCDEANSGAYDQSAGVISVNVDFGNDFDAGDVLHVTVNDDTLLFVLTLLPSTEIFLWVGTNNGDYEIPSTGSYLFNTVLTAVPLGTATLTVTCDEAPDEDEDEGDDEGDVEGEDEEEEDPSHAAARLVDRLVMAVRQSDNLGTMADDLPRATSNLRHEFLLRALNDYEDRVAGLGLLLLAAPDDPEVLAKLNAARARVSAVRHELGIIDNGGLPGEGTPLGYVDPDAETGSLPEAFEPIVSISGGLDHMTMKATARPDVSTIVQYRGFDRAGPDGLAGWGFTGTREVEFKPVPRVSGGLFARVGYFDVDAVDGTGSLQAFTYGLGAKGALELMDRLVLRGTVLYERGENTAFANGASGSFDSETAVVAAAMRGSFWLGSLRFAPSVSVRYEQTRRDGYVDSSATLVPGGWLHLGRLSAEQEIALSRALTGADGGIVTIHPFVVGGIDWDFLHDGGVAVGDASLFDPGIVVLRAGGGVRIHWSDQAWFQVAAEYSAGGDGRSRRLQTELNLPLGGGAGYRDSSLRLTGYVDQAGDASASARAVISLN